MTICPDNCAWSVDADYNNVLSDGAIEVYTDIIGI